MEKIDCGCMCLIGWKVEELEMGQVYYFSKNVY